MMHRIVLSALIATVAAVAGAEQFGIVVDADRSGVEFELKATLHTVRGSAEIEEGDLRLDPVSGTIRGRVVVSALSAETGNGSRDKKMHAKVLLSERFPTIVLRPERYAGTLELEGESSLNLVATMEIIGTRHEISMPLAVAIRDGRVIADAEFRVPYVEWGLKNPSNFALRVAKEVLVTVHLEGKLVEKQ
jgi:hypothetical protein